MDLNFGIATGMDSGSMAGHGFWLPSMDIGFGKSNKASHGFFGDLTLLASGLFADSERITVTGRSL